MNILVGILYAFGLSNIDDVLAHQRLIFLMRQNERLVQRTVELMKEFQRLMVLIEAGGER